MLPLMLLLGLLLGFPLGFLLGVLLVLLARYFMMFAIPDFLGLYEFKAL